MKRSMYKVKHCLRSLCNHIRRRHRKLHPTIALNAISPVAAFKTQIGIAGNSENSHKIWRGCKIERATALPTLQRILRPKKANKGMFTIQNVRANDKQWFTSLTSKSLNQHIRWDMRIFNPSPTNSAPLSPIALPFWVKWVRASSS